uniref:Uncharacterized protein n=1 Tax=Ananas comosus var. bracteatus TaxID=296719 RepID=A0A6V7NH53_ANACO|nr:unnamed protein product [Ananas comosus var. bracteatus]
MALREETVRKVLRERILAVRFLPLATTSSQVSLSPISVQCGVRGSLRSPCNVVGLVDRLFVGENHFYQRPVYKRTKECSVNSPDYGPLPPNSPNWCLAPFDPEGLLSHLHEFEVISFWLNLNLIYNFEMKTSKEKHFWRRSYRDVTHPKSGEDSSPSIAAVVASQDWPEITKYAGVVCAQTHRQGLIRDLYKDVE